MQLRIVTFTLLAATGPQGISEGYIIAWYIFYDVVCDKHSDIPGKLLINCMYMRVAYHS